MHQWISGLLLNKPWTKWASKGHHAFCLHLSLPSLSHVRRLSQFVFLNWFMSFLSVSFFLLTAMQQIFILIFPHLLYLNPCSFTHTYHCVSLLNSPHFLVCLIYNIINFAPNLAHMYLPFSFILMQGFKVLSQIYEENDLQLCIMLAICAYFLTLRNQNKYFYFYSPYAHCTVPDSGCDNEKGKKAVRICIRRHTREMWPPGDNLDGAMSHDWV